MRTVRIIVGVLLLCVPLASACRSARFDPSEIDRHAPLRDVPRGFLLGVATSAYQIEGGNQNDWTDWERGSYRDGSPHVEGHATATITADSWNRFASDVAAIETLGANLYRLGIEWSRLEPQEGVWDGAAVARYREILIALRQATPHAIKPMLNLYHFTLPRWVAERGGWEWPGAVPAFAAFAARAGESFGDLVDDWCTLNEPNVFATKGYLSGEWPPGVQDPRRALRVLATLMRAHGAATTALRARDRTDTDGDGKATRIGLAHNVRVFDPAAAWNPLDRLVAHYADQFYNRAVTDAVANARIQISLPTVASIDEPAPELAGSFDWLGLNYYTRDVVRGRLGAALGGGGRPYEVVAEAGASRSDMGWPIYPEGLLRMLREFAAYGWPILVTENGIADAAGTLRPEFIRAHVYALDEARRQGVNVIGYVHWSLIDNFEWSHGYAGRFGLFTIDFAHDRSLRRTATPAVATFQELARRIGLLPGSPP
jgi:beta-glucosidase